MIEYSSDESPQELAKFISKNRSSLQLRPSAVQKYEQMKVLSNISKTIDFQIQYPQADIQLDIPSASQIIDRQERRVNIVPNPPRIRTIQQSRNLRDILKLIKRYEYIWVLICKKDHEAVKTFEQLYQQDRLRNSHQRLQNLLLPKQSQKLLNLIAQGIQVKLMMDTQSYLQTTKCLGDKLKTNTKIMQIVIEQDKHSDTHLYSYKKITVVKQLKNTIEERVQKQVERTRKDKPYFNFVHMDSSAQLFTRRSLIQGCLMIEHKNQLMENSILFQAQVRKHFQKFKKDKTSELINSNNAHNIKIWQGRFLDRQRIVKGFFQKLQKQNQNFQNQDLNSQFNDQVIKVYTQQTSIYPVLNNTIRFSFNQEKIKPVSVMVYYLYRAIRNLFINNYKRIAFRKVYRGGKVSILQQQHFKQGKYFWNLGFMSTSVNESVAKGFLPQSDDESVLFEINIPDSVLQTQNLEQQQGFYPLYQIPNIQNKIKLQHQVLFNPLNTFIVKKWEKSSKRRVLKLDYAPHIPLIAKKQIGQNISQQQQQFLNSIQKLKNKDYDKGKKCLDQGDPISAIKYYEHSQNIGEQLSDTQKSVYFESLQSVGDIKKIDQLLRQQIQNEEGSSHFQKQKKLDSIEDVAKQMNTIKLYEESTEFQRLTEKTQNIIESIQDISINQINSLPKHANILLEMRGYVELASVRLKINDTLSGIQNSLSALILGDQLCYLNYKQNLKQFVDKLKILNIASLQKQCILNKIIKTDQNDLFMNEEQIIENFKAFKSSQTKMKHFFDKEGQMFIQKSKPQNIRHQSANKIVDAYISNRQKRNKIQQFQELIMLSYQQLSTTKNDLSKSENIQMIIKNKQIHKQLKDKLLSMRLAYSQQIYTQYTAYSVLYQIIYKTSINVLQFFNGYKQFFCRYQQYMSKVQPGTKALAEVIQKHGEILIDYGHIFEAHGQIKSPSIQDGIKKVQSAKDILNNISKNKKGYHWSRNLCLTKQTMQNSIILKNHYRTSISEDQKAKKSALNKLHYKKKEKMKQNKEQEFLKLIRLLEQISQGYRQDRNMNQVFYQLKIFTERIQIINASYDIQTSNKLQIKNYQSRLKQCQGFYFEVIKLIQEYNYQQLMQKNLNMCHLYLMMAQNQYKLGLNSKATNFISKCQYNLKKIFKENQQSMKIDKKKLMFGNKTYIGLLKLKATVISYSEKRSIKKDFYRDLSKIKCFIASNMHEPFNQAQITGALGILASQLFLLFNQMTYSDSQIYLLKSIELRQKLFGKFNKEIARSYTLLMEIAFYKHKKQFNKKCQYYYDEGNKIYLQLDCQKDPTVIIYKTLHKNLKQEFTGNHEKANKQTLRGFSNYIQQENHHVTIEMAKEIFRNAKQLGKKDKQIKVKYMNLCLFYCEQIQDYLMMLYKSEKSKDDSDKQGINNIQQFKKQILQSLIKQNPQNQQLYQSKLKYCKKSFIYN